MTKQIITETYKLTPAVYFKVAVGAILPKISLISLLLILTSLIIGLIFDIRLIFITLIIAFIAIPMIVSHIYFSKLLTTDAQYALMPKHIVINTNRNITEVFENADEKSNPPKPRTWQWEAIKSRKIANKHIIIKFFNNNYTLIIPLKAINNNIDINQIAEPTE